MACDWPIDTTCCTAWEAVPDPDQAARQEAAEAFATWALWALTGRRLGTCPVTVRPCWRPCNPRTYMTFGVWMTGYGVGDSAMTWIPYVGADGEWRNCGCMGLCCCGVSCEVWLPGPVASITEVKINNVVLDNTGGAAYRVDDGQYLVRHDGECWPECANLDVPATSPDNTFVVTYGLGIPLDIATPRGRAAALAAGALACEYLRACMGGPCVLPQQVTSISRGGVNFEVIDPATLFEDGLTGVKLADDFIRYENPYKLREAPTVWSPDMPFTRVQTWP